MRWLVICVLTLIALATVSGFCAFKLYCIDAFNPKLLAVLDTTRIPQESTVLSELTLGQYCVCGRGIVDILLQDGVIVPTNKKYLAVSGCQIIAFKPDSFHSVKGEPIVQTADTKKIYFYSFNQRYEFPINIPLSTPQERPDQPSR